MKKEINTITEDELKCLTVQQVAELLNQSVSEIRKLIKDGTLKAFHPTKGSVRIRKIKLLQYIEEKEEEEQW